MSHLGKLLGRSLSLPGLAPLVLRIRTSNPLILMYHGIGGDESLSGLSSLETKHIPRAIFEGHLRLLSSTRHVIPLSEMVDGLVARRDMRNAVAITFDDGYENNYTRAAPLLAAHHMSAAFFVTTDYIGTDRWMWTDRLQALLDRTHANEVSVPGGSQRLCLRTAHERLSALQSLKARLKRVTPAECEASMAQIQDELGDLDDRPFGDHRFMSWAQVKALADAGFEIGAHTATHPILSRVSVDDALDEIVRSRERVVAEVGHCSDVFCYPNGKAEDITAPITEFCKRHFRAALSTMRGPARLSDLYALHRIGAPYDRRIASLTRDLIRER